jgi:ubiquinone/menaquinone biosynthesis C-methylase UbiE
MIKITKNGQFGKSLESFAYIESRGLSGRIILPITRYLRAINAEKYMNPAERHLDIGCGDGYFLRRSKCQERFGMDKLLGDDVTDKLDFPDSYFDYVTMLAVIEHVSCPEKIFMEVARVLKTDGRFIITTPRKSADLLIKIYAKNIDEEHVEYFDYNRIKELAGKKLEIIAYHKFFFCFNQVFVLKRLSLVNEFVE